MGGYLCITKRKRNIEELCLMRYKVWKASLLLLGLVFFVNWIGSLGRAVNPRDKELYRFVIQRGESAGEIATKLKSAGLIKSRVVFKLIVRAKNVSTKIEAGEFLLSPSLSTTQIVEKLLKGALDIWVTIPEGLRSEEVALRIKREIVDFDTAEFVKLVTENKYEGYLFPDTYLFPKTATAPVVLPILTANFQKKAKPLLGYRRNGLSEYETLIMASIVEREAAKNPDRAIVAGILIKRLKAGWGLDVDATLQYAKSTLNCKDALDCNWWSQPTSADKKIKSPYNTYMYRGLPPGPIANPGIEAIKAVASPIESRYWFYISGKDGTSYFAETLNEHQQNIDLYLK